MQTIILGLYCLPKCLLGVSDLHKKGLKRGYVWRLGMFQMYKNVWNNNNEDCLVTIKNMYIITSVSVRHSGCNT